MTNKSIYNYAKNAQDDDKLVVASFRGFKTTRKTFFKQVDNLATYLLSMGLKKGDAVTVCLPNFPSAVVAMYAINKAGGIVNVLHPLTPPKALRENLEGKNCKILFYFDNFCKKAQNELSNWQGKVIVCSASDYLKGIEFFGMSVRDIFHPSRYLPSKQFILYRKTIKNNKLKANFPEIKGEDVCLYLNSGGTTGSPKTVKISNKALNELAPAVSSLCREKRPGDSMLMVLPFFHGFGIGVCVHHSLYAGMKIVMVPSFNPKAINSIIRRERVTHLCGVPNMFDKMMKERNFRGKYLSNLKNAYSGGDSLSSEIKEKFDKILEEYGGKARLVEGYGLAETIAVSVSNTLWDNQPQCLGKAVLNNKAIVLSNDDIPLPCGEVGELAISSPSMMDGYLEGEDPFVFYEGEKYVKTGDLASISEDGHIYFHGRKKRMDVISGVNIFPLEIERAVNKIDGIKESCAVVKKKNGKKYIKIYITLVEYKNQKEYYTSIIIESLKKSFTKYAIPKEVEILHEMPRTALNKIDFISLQAKEDEE